MGCTNNTEVIPARVVSGSMAPHYLGEHWEVHCEDCGFTFRCGVEHPPDGMLAVCPNCGYAENEVVEDERLPGSAVDVVPRDFADEPPRRWEVVAFNEPGEDRVAVKRVVGLPGEKVSIRAGDVFVDGHRAQKSMQEFAALGQLLCDPSYFPKSLDGLPPRWHTAERDSRWESVANEVRPGSYQCLHSTQTATDFDWLAYRHINATSAADRTQSGRILDNYAYNQGLARGLNAVSDVVIVCGVKISDGGEFAIRLWEGEQPLVVALVPRENIVTLTHGDILLAEAPTSTPLAGGEILNMKLGFVDHRVLVEIDDELTLALDLDSTSPAIIPSDVSLALACRNLDAEVQGPMPLRDIYYLNPHHRPVDWEMEVPLGEDEYFLLGDNPPNSRDSRHYGPVTGAARMGTVENRMTD